MAQIALTNGKTITVDASDLSKLSKYSWHPITGGYAAAWINGENIHLHRFVLGLGSTANDPIYVDHINGDRSDCRKSNLRKASMSQNGMNRRKVNGCSSKYKGVTWKNGRWYAAIKVNGKSKHLGCFQNEKDAARAYNQAASEHFGIFARLNAL